MTKKNGGSKVALERKLTPKMEQKLRSQTKFNRRQSIEERAHGDIKYKSEKKKSKVLNALAETTSIKMEKRFMFEFEQLCEIDCQDENVTNKDRFKYLFTSKGFKLDDPRIKDIIDVVDELEEDQDIDFDIFKELIRPISTFFRDILQNNLSLKDIESFSKSTREIFEKHNLEAPKGSMAKYLSETSNANQDDFAASICTVDGQRIELGSSDSLVSLQQISSVVSYLIALEQHGQESLSKYIGTEPSGKSFDNLELKEGIPHNPLISSGNLLCCSLINQKETIDRKYEKYAKVVEKMIGAKVSFNNSVYLNQKERAHRNFCLLYMLEEAGTLPEGADVKEIMNFFTQTTSIEMKVSDYSVMAATLANGGICPLTDENVFSDSEAIKGTLSQMLCCGMNTFSGKWAFDVGLPAKSSTTGMTILVIPNKMGIAVWSPRLNKDSNSVRGQKFLCELIDTFGFNDIDHVYGAGLMKKMLVNLSFKGTHNNDSINLLYYAKQNKLREMRKAVAQG